MTSTPDEPPSLQSPQDSDSESPLPNRKTRRAARSPLASDPDLPYRRSNASLSNLFASTTSLPTKGSAASQSDSGAVTPHDAAANGSVFSPAGSTVRASSPVPSTRGSSGGHEARDAILRAFSPHVSVLPSQDTEELIRHKGIHGGLLELLRPFGERVPGKVTIRDSVGASRSWEDYAVRFVGVKDGMESPRPAPASSNNRNSTDSSTARNGQRTSTIHEYKPARLRTGGGIPQIEELIERHLTFAEEQSGPFLEADYINIDKDPADPTDPSPFYLLYLRRLLSGLPLVPSETFAHPIASVIAISSRSQSPIEDLRTLYASSNTGEHRLPHWVHNEFLRYYLLVHDEDYDDLQKSMQLYEQMIRHFGLHCHLLRLRSKPCSSPASSPSSPPSSSSSSSSDNNDEAEEKIRLPMPSWLSAAEELAEITRRETSEEDDVDILTPFIFTTDATNLRAFVREMVTQSIIPSMERASANWNDQVASRRRGISGRFMSLSKRFTAFGSSGSRVSSTPVGGSGGIGNYDSLQGFYRPDAPEAVMRRLADFSMMLRDFKLARGTYEILCQDFKNDKAWRYYAGANEMAAISSLIVATGGSGGAGGGGSSSGGGSKTSRASVGGGTDVMVEQYLETAYYSYITRVGAPYNALRTLVLAIELLKLRGGGRELDEAAKWASRILDDRLVGPVGHVLLMERIGACYATDRKGVNGTYEKRRKAAFGNMLACDAWLRLEKGARAERCLGEAERLFGLDEGKVEFRDMERFLHQLRDAVRANRSGPQHLDGEDLLFGDEVTMVEPLQDENERLARRSSISGGGVGGVPIIASPMHGHRKSISVSNAPPIPPPPLQTSFDPLGGVVPSGYDVATPGSVRQRHRALSAASATAAGTGIGGAKGLSPHPEEDLPIPPTPMSAARVLERRDPRDDGFE